MTARDIQIEKIRSIRYELRMCRRNTPHYRDTKKHLIKQIKALKTYDALQGDQK